MNELRALSMMLPLLLLPLRSPQNHQSAALAAHHFYARLARKSKRLHQSRSLSGLRLLDQRWMPSGMRESVFTEGTQGVELYSFYPVVTEAVVHIAAGRKFVLTARKQVAEQ